MRFDELGILEFLKRGQMKQDCDRNEKYRNDDQRIWSDELIRVVTGKKLDRRR